MSIFGKKDSAKKTSHSGKATRGANVRHARSRKPVQGSEHEVIRAPWLSEKALIATERGIYTFAVSSRATKADIAGAIKEIYKVSPRKIRIVHVKGKQKTMRTKRGVGQRANRKKAYVYLNTGDTIQFG